MKFMYISLIIALSIMTVTGWRKNRSNKGFEIDRTICTSCTGTNTGCASTEYCLGAGNIISPSCCRAKQAAGQPCVPKDGGIDCTSGTCNNLIPTFSFFGITWNFQAFNPLGGTCA